MSQKCFHEVLTFKSGKFVFSSCHNEAALAPRLAQLNTLRRILATLPLLPELTAFPAELLRQSIRGTAAIEGNPLNEEEVGRILARPESVPAGDEWQKEIANLKKAYDHFLGQQVPSPLLLSEQLIQNIHAVITHGLSAKENILGKYRNTKVVVGDIAHGGTYVPPRILEDIKTLMAAFIDWINKDSLLELHPLVRAALAHYHLGVIHPFRDGNGRTARLLEAMILAASGWKHFGMMLSTYYHEHVDDYYAVFRRCERSKEHDLQPFVDMCVSGAIDRFDMVHERVMASLRKVSLKEYVRTLLDNKTINLRQYDLAMLLFNSSHSIRLQDLHASPLFLPLYRNVSEQTARRDLRRLLEYKVLEKNDGRYSLGIRSLDL